MGRLGKYVTAFLLGTQNSMEYRSNFLLGLVSFIFPLTIQYYLWTGIYRGDYNVKVYGYTFSQMISYAVIAVLVSKLVSAGVEWEVLEDIKNGGLSKFVIKPIGYLPYRVSCFLGQKCIQSVLIFIILAVVLILLNIFLGFRPGIINIGMFIVALIMALLINFLIYFTIAAFAFWITEAWGAFVFLNVFVNIISGGIFPLDVFGGNVIRIFDLLPFKYTIYFPVTVLNGRIELDEILKGVVIQLIWVLAMLLVTKLVWKAGMKKYTAVGG